VEVQSASDEPKAMDEKRALYGCAGASLLCRVRPEKRTVTAYRSDEERVQLTEADTLVGGDVLPGLSIPVSDTFG
jgi:Uma2 family endonuclease